MKKRAINWLPVAIIVVGAILRVLSLGKYPSGFFRDEAALGYNAFSIFLTGKDEYGMLLPLVFRSFEVFFLPLYVYLSAPLIGLIGLSEFSARFLSAISGIAALFLIYFIAREVWGKKTAIFSTLVLAISPWHIFYSRGVFEGNLALTLFSVGFLFWIKFIKSDKTKHFFLSTSLFAASMYAYQAERVVVPIFAVLAIIHYFPKLKKNWTKLIKPSLAVFVLLVPLFSLTFRAGGYHRAFGVSVFSKNQNPPGYEISLSKDNLLNSKFYFRARQVTALYFSYFSPRNLFFEGDYDRQRSVENNSVFYPWMLPFMIIGIAMVVKKTSGKKRLLLSWMLIAPLPAALTGDPFHTYRSLLLYVPITLLIGRGLSQVYIESRRTFRKVFPLVVAGLSVTSVVFFAFSYFVLTPTLRAKEWDYGYKEIVEFVNTFPEDKRIVFNDPRTESYIHILFFEENDPSIYHKAVEESGFSKEFYYEDAEENRPVRYKNYEFRQVDWPSERGDEGTVFIMSAETLPESEFINDPKIELLKEIYYPNGDIAYRIVEVK